MGSRANIAIDFGKDDHDQPRRVYLYSHWDGPAIALKLRDACKEGRRLDDAQYFSRIVFDKMVGKQQGEETGYGISPVICDNQYGILVVNCDEGRVWVDGAEDRQWSMAEFGALDDAAATAAMGG